mmetsp:Transcript_29207/g.73219  ORF Transcript_29207/g.73219 Transcript_29207/m.73219 type:complete len:142 (+) Transcript_29207:2477-2902(+)
MLHAAWPRYAVLPDQGIKPRSMRLITALLSMSNQRADRTGRRQVSVECKLAADVEEFVSNFRPELMDAVAAWASGSSFRSLLKMIPAFEGSIVRAIRRLHEVLLQLEAACKAVGEVGLQEKFEQASAQVKRDIVFAASLYL